MVSTKEYGDSLKEIPLPKAKINSELLAEELTVLKQFCGQINWLSTQGRPDVAFDSCQLANSLKSQDRKVFAYANKVIRKIQSQNVELRFHRRFDLQSCYLVSFCDASFANLPNAGSQGSYVLLLVDGNGVYCPIGWQSRKIRRVVKSTIAAECLAAVEAAEMTIYMANVLKDILQLSDCVKTYVFCDNKNLVNAAHSSTNIEDKRLIIDISVLRDLLQRQELTDFVWVSTERQLANALTKQGAADDYMLNVFNTDMIFKFDSVAFH